MSLDNLDALAAFPFEDQLQLAPGEACSPQEEAASCATAHTARRCAPCGQSGRLP